MAPLLPCPVHKTDVVCRWGGVGSALDFPHLVIIRAAIQSVRPSALPPPFFLRMSLGWNNRAVKGGRMHCVYHTFACLCLACTERFFFKPEIKFLTRGHRMPEAKTSLFFCFAKIFLLPPSTPEKGRTPTLFFRGGIEKKSRVLILFFHQVG